MKANCTVYIKKDDGIAVRDADRLVAAATNFSSEGVCVKACGFDKNSTDFEVGKIEVVRKI